MVQQRPVAIVVDSSFCIPAELLQKYGIIVVPQELVVGDRTYRDGVDMHPSQFYEILKRNQTTMSTNAPRPPAFFDAFKQAAGQAGGILCLTISSRFSSTYNSARVGAEMATAALPRTPVRVMDTRAAAGAAGFVALAAARAVASGKDLDAVAECAAQMVPRVNLLALLDTLAYLSRSGRVPRIAAWAGSILDIKPMAELKDGEAHLVEKPRSRAKAVQRLVEVMRDRVDGAPAHVNVMHANCLPDAEELRKQVERDFRCTELLLTEFSPVMGAHTGPGLLGLAFYKD